MDGTGTEEAQTLSIETYEARKRIVFEITGKYQLERYVYLVSSISSLLIILYLAFDLYRTQKITLEQLALFIGPTGFLAYAVSRILYMWSQSLKIVFTGKF